MASEDRECPLCMERMESDDLAFFPCNCNYQICRFCWSKIINEENGLCPACRSRYDSEKPDLFQPLPDDGEMKFKPTKRKKDQNKKNKLTPELLKHLPELRVVQTNLVFVVGLPTWLSKEKDALKGLEYFGRFGKVFKVEINQNQAFGGPQGTPSISAYVTFVRPEDAMRAIVELDQSTLDGRQLRVSLGTTKYCSQFLRGSKCTKKECMYLHELGNPAASFTKEQMQAGKHTEYMNKLLSSYRSSLISRPSDSASQPSASTSCSTSSLSSASNSVLFPHSQTSYPRSKFPDSSLISNGPMTSDQQSIQFPDLKLVNPIPPLTPSDSSEVGKVTLEKTSLKRNGGGQNKRSANTTNHNFNSNTNHLGNQLPSQSKIDAITSQRFAASQKPKQSNLQPYPQNISADHSSIWLLKSGTTGLITGGSPDTYSNQTLNASKQNTYESGQLISFPQCNGVSDTQVGSSLSVKKVQSKIRPDQTSPQSSDSAPHPKQQLLLSSAPVKSSPPEDQKSQNNSPLLGGQHSSRDVTSFSSQTQPASSDPPASSSGPIHDVELGFDPFQESQQGLAELVAAENNYDDSSSGQIPLGFSTYNNMQRHVSNSPAFSSNATNPGSTFSQWLPRPALNEDPGFQSLNHGNSFVISSAIQPPPGFESRIIPPGSDMPTSDLNGVPSHLLTSGRHQVPFANTTNFSTFSTQHQSSLEDCIKPSPDFQQFPPGLVDPLNSGWTTRSPQPFGFESSTVPTRNDSNQAHLASCMAALQLQTNQPTLTQSNLSSTSSRTSFPAYDSNGGPPVGLKRSLEELGTSCRSSGTDRTDQNPSRKQSLPSNQANNYNPLAQVDWNALAQYLYQLQQQSLLQNQDSSGSSVNSTAAVATQSSMMTALLMTLGLSNPTPNTSNGSSNANESVGNLTNGLHSPVLDPFTAVTIATLLAQSSNLTNNNSHTGSSAIEALLNQSYAYAKSEQGSRGLQPSRVPNSSSSFSNGGEISRQFLAPGVSKPQPVSINQISSSNNLYQSKEDSSRKVEDSYPWQLDDPAIVSSHLAAGTSSWKIPTSATYPSEVMQELWRTSGYPANMSSTFPQSPGQSNSPDPTQLLASEQLTNCPSDSLRFIPSSGTSLSR